MSNAKQQKMAKTDASQTALQNFFHKLCNAKIKPTRDGRMFMFLKNSHHMLANCFFVSAHNSIVLFSALSLKLGSNLQQF